MPGGVSHGDHVNANNASGGEAKEEVAERVGTGPVDINLEEKEAECIRLGEQWMVQGPKIMEYVRKLTDERYFIQDTMSKVRDGWQLERLQLEAVIKTKNLAWEEACLKCWELGKRCEDYEREIADHDRQKEALVSRLDIEKKEFCAEEQRKVDKRLFVLDDKYRASEVTVRRQEKQLYNQKHDILKLKTALAKKEREVENLKAAQEDVVRDFENKIKERISGLRALAFGLLGAVLRTHGNIITPKEVEDIFYKLHLEFLTDEHFYEVVDQFAALYTQELDAKQDKESNLEEQLFRGEIEINEQQFTENATKSIIDMGGLESAVFKLFGKPYVTVTDIREFCM